LSHATEALRIAEHLGDDRALAEALALVALYEFLSGDTTSQKVIDRAVALEETGGGPRPLRSPRFFRGCMLMWSDDLQGARSIFGELEKRCREGGDESSLSVVLFLLSELECRAGNWAAAQAHADESCAITSWTGQQGYRAFALFAKALVDAHAGRSEAARAAAGEGVSFAERTGSSQAKQLNLRVLGFVELSLGNFKAANGHLWPLAHELLETGIGEPGAARFVPDEIEALLALGESDKAQALLYPFLERAEMLRRTWALATGARCQGLLAQSRGELADALEAFDRALEIHRSLDEPFDLGRTLVAYGQMLRRLKKWGRARESLDEALEIFDRLGAEVWADRVRGELARVGGRAPTPLALSATEQRVAELAAGGSTNREIAESLFLSVSSVEANLRRIYRKLGIRSRTELAYRLNVH
jgi:ATP/maltotriose-dependent transcriptional regulator MalT